MAETLVSKYIQCYLQAQSVEEFHAVCSDLCHEAGLDHFLFCARVPVSLVEPFVLIISGYPDAWRERYNAAGHVIVDPTVAHCATRATPLIWQDLAPLEKQNPKIRTFMEEARDFGLRTGASFPVHTPSGESAMLSFSCDRDPGRNTPDLLQHLPSLQLLAAHAHEAARRIIEIKEIGPPRPSISPREKECLLWTAEGKTAWEISQILGISERTVIFHLRNAGEKLDVANRQQAVARAVSLGLILPQIA